MNRAPVLFRVDAGPRIGWENLYRCLVFAGALQRRRRPAYFLAQLEPGALGLNVKRAGNDWLAADAPAGTVEDLEETLQEIRRLRPAAVIVDSPEVMAHCTIARCVSPMSLSAPPKLPPWRLKTT